MEINTDHCPNFAPFEIEIVVQNFTYCVPDDASNEQAITTQGPNGLWRQKRWVIADPEHTRSSSTIINSASQKHNQSSFNPCNIQLNLVKPSKCCPEKSFRDNPFTKIYWSLLEFTVWVKLLFTKILSTSANWR